MTTIDTVSASLPGTRTTHRQIPLTRIIGTELRKMFDTRSGFWLMASIAIQALLATAAVILFAPTEELTYSTFTTAVSVPLTVVLPIIAILSVTSEWSQRSGLTIFALIPHRGRVIAAKAIACIGVAVVSIPFAIGIGAVGNLVETAIAGVDPVWDLSVSKGLTIVLANVLALLVGFMLGVVIRSSTRALVAYVVYAFLLPTLAMLLAASQQWFRALQPWVDFDHAQSVLFAGAPTVEQWAHLAVTGMSWSSR